MPSDPDPIEPATRLLGFFEAPQLIQCRKCKALKKALNVNFRNIRGKTDRFRFTCRNCERQTAHARTVDAKIAAIRNRPLLTDAERAALIEGDSTPLRPGVAEQVSAATRARRRKARVVTLEDTFRQSWHEVRKAIAARRVDLDNRLRSAKYFADKSRGQTGVHYCRQAHPQCERYVRLVLATYSSVVSRLRHIREWRQTIGLHMPPKHWIDALGKGKAGLMEVSPFEFTTAEEREALRRADPAKAGGACAADWSYMVADSDRKNATMKYHVYPLWLANGKTIAQTSPDWLKRFNKAGDEHEAP